MTTLSKLDELKPGMIIKFNLLYLVLKVTKTFRKDHHDLILDLWAINEEHKILGFLTSSTNFTILSN